MTLEEIKLIDSVLAEISAKGNFVFAVAQARNILGREAQKFEPKKENEETGKTETKKK